MEGVHFTAGGCLFFWMFFTAISLFVSLMLVLALLPVFGMTAISLTAILSAFLYGRIREFLIDEITKEF